MNEGRTEVFMLLIVLTVLCVLVQRMCPCENIFAYFLF